MRFEVALEHADPPAAAMASQSLPPERRRGWARACLSHPAVAAGASLIALFTLVAVGADFLATHSPTVGGDLRTERLLPPGSEFWFGTDDQARDIYSRVVHGTRLTLLVVVASTVVSTPLGLLIGVVAGYFGGLVDTALMRLTDIALAFPKLILALAIAAALGPGIENAILAIAATTWPTYARLARAETRRFRGSDFVAAARLQGAGRVHILRRHVVPLCMPSVIVRSALDMAGIIITAAALGFLGLGAAPPAAEWGAMIATGQRFLLDQWWVATIPGIAICLLSFAFNLLADGLRDVLDPRTAT